MYLLIPFYIFTHEANFKIYNNDIQLLQNLLDEFIEICDKLNRLAIEEKVTEFEKRTIIELSKKVIDNIARKYDNIREGVDIIMGGKVINSWRKTHRLACGMKATHFLLDFLHITGIQYMYQLKGYLSDG